MNNNPACDIAIMFLNHFTQEFSSGYASADQMKLDQEIVSALLKNMDTEYDRGILRAIIALLHKRSETVSLGIALKQQIQKAYSPHFYCI